MIGVTFAQLTYSKTGQPPEDAFQSMLPFSTESLLSITILAAVGIAVLVIITMITCIRPHLL